MRRLATYGFNSQPVICLTKASHKTANVGRSAQMFTVWQWSFRKTEKWERSRVTVQAPGRFCGGAGLSSRKKYWDYMHAKSCNLVQFGRKMVRNAVHNAFLKPLTMRTPSLCVLAAYQQWERRNAFPLEMTPAVWCSVQHAVIISSSSNARWRSEVLLRMFRLPMSTESTGPDSVSGACSMSSSHGLLHHAHSIHSIQLLARYQLHHSFHLPAVWRSKFSI